MTPTPVGVARGRTLPAGLAPVVEALELDQRRLVTTQLLEELRLAAGLETPARVIAARLRERGWLLPTRRRGVYEFAPGAHAGALSRGERTLQLQAALTAQPTWPVGLTLQSAAWALGLADRAPARLEVAAPDRHITRALGAVLADEARVLTFAPKLAMVQARGVPVLSPASVLVHMTTHPSHVRSWDSALEWLPDLAAECTGEDVTAEVSARPHSVAARTAYLLSGLRPDIASRLPADPTGKVYFGQRGPTLRHDAAHQVADTTLPFDPRDLPAVGR